jgi:hypothetical protein
MDLAASAVVDAVRPPLTSAIVRSASAAACNRHACAGPRVAIHADQYRADVVESGRGPA